MALFFNTQKRRLQKICKEYEKTFDTEIPDIETKKELTALKHHKLELLALAFDEEGGAEYVLKMYERLGWPNVGINLDHDGLFIPELSRCKPWLGTSESIEPNYSMYRPSSISKNIRRLRYVKLKKEGFYQNLGKFNWWYDYHYPNPEQMIKR